MSPEASEFSPAWWCPGPHLQTIFARFFRPQPRDLILKRVRIETPDQDFLDLDFLQGSPGAPRVILLHGLEGSSEAPYMRSLLGVFQKEGWHAVAVNFRGCSLEPGVKLSPFGRDLGRRKIQNLLRQSYHSGKTEDLDFVLEYLRRSDPVPVQYLVGFSIGGNIVLKWLGEKGELARGQIKRAAAVSVPCDLVRSVEKMDRGINREIYTRTLLESIRRKFEEKEKIFPGIADLKKVRACTTFNEFDELVTAPLNGFRDAMHYWTASSSAAFLEHIRVPALIVHAEDDPFFPGEFFPVQKALQNSWLTTCVTKQGGHLGFVSGIFPWKQVLWLENRILSYFKAQNDSIPIIH